ncbi:nucleoside phosphorylase domain-containing protein [Aspergillus undulatus]|uniref:nucleoside phosphorylase domain-containing protein n=1 Tax=Aspergillus undulatus TaxID=1810928 RepID=UPI003CCCF1D7
MHPHVPNIEEYHVAWITALPTEFSAATAMLDEQYEHSVDTALYTLGRICWHNVVIVCLPAGHIGTTAAATTVLQMTLKFPALKVGLLIGVGAGVPSTGVDIRLGDVVISQPQRGYGGVVQYDFNKITPGGKHNPIGYLNGPPRILLSALTMLKARVMMGDTSITSHLEALEAFPSFSPATPTPDILFRADYEHIEGPTCEACRKDMAIERPKRGDGDMSIKLPKRVDQDIVLHYGIIASGNQVLRDGLTRDRLSTELGGVLCFEMEAAGLLNILPCIVIRGICDYGDSHKNKMWQPCAAGNAAACAKELLTYVPPFFSSKTSGSDRIERGPGTGKSPSRDSGDTIGEPSMKASTEKEQGAIFADPKQEVGIDGLQPLEELLGLRQLYPSSLRTLPPGLEYVKLIQYSLSHQLKNP